MKERKNMSLKVSVTATVNYTCFLSAKDSEMVTAYAEYEGVSLEEAVGVLYDEGVIALYYNSVERDFQTDSIDLVEKD
jgi:hypothetical protein